MVHCSTGGVHGHIANPPANEDAPFNPGDVYQETKLEAEQLAREFGNRTGFDVVVARPIGIYGPGDTRFLQDVPRPGARRFPMIGSGQVFYHLTFIDDLVEGFRLCGTVPGGEGPHLSPGGPALHDARTAGRPGGEGAERARRRACTCRCGRSGPPGLLCEMVCVPLRIEPPIYRRRVDFYTKSRAFDTTRARTELGFAPQVDLEEGIKRTADWYRSEGLAVNVRPGSGPAEHRSHLRPPRLGRLAHARREAPVRVDDPALRQASASTSR